MAPSLVTFTNSSLNATTFSWDFGDGESSTDENPTHLYAEGGNYNVSLTANGEDNQVNIISKTVSIDEVPSKLKITNLVVNTMPMTDSNGSNWDILDGPDVLYKILQGTVGLSASSSQDNLTVSDFPLAFTEGFPIELGNLIAEHSIVLEESDLFSTTEIGSLTFTPSTYMPVDETSEYPNNITLGDATLEVVLSVEWVE